MGNTAERLNQIMNERNLKQIDIINKSMPFQKKYGVNMSKSHLSQYVNNKSQPDQHKLFLLAETLNVNEAWLMGYDVKKERTRVENEIETIAAHHDGDDWSDEELEEIEEFKKYIKSKRQK